MSEIDKLAEQYMKARELLTMRVKDLKHVLDQIKRRRMAGIQDALGSAAQHEAELRDAITGSPELFEKPRTQIMHGIKLGYHKGQGKLEWDDDAHVCRLIHRQFPDLVETLIKVEESPVRSALKNLSAAELARCGVSVVETGDEIVVKPVDGEIDKLVAALLADAIEEESEAVKSAG